MGMFVHGGNDTQGYYERVEAERKTSYGVVDDHAAQHDKPRTQQDVLLEKWRDEVYSMAGATVWRHYHSALKTFMFHDGYETTSLARATEHEIAWLLSPAEDGK